MFAQHQPTIEHYARSGPDQFARVLQFAMLSAHAPFQRMPADMRSAETGDDRAVSVLFGHKAAAWGILWGERDNLYGECEMLAREASGEDLAASLIGFLAEFPGLGLVKAGFAAQMAYGVGGCLDTHNLARYGFNPRRFRPDKYKACKRGKAKLARLSDYVTACYAQGGPSKLWDTWCAYVAREYPAVYRNAWHVSSLHCEVLGLETGKES